MTARRAAACEFWSGYSRAFKEVIIKDLYCHAELVEESVVLMIVTKDAKIAVIVVGATGTISAVSPAIGVYTFSGDVRDVAAHTALCATAASHLKESQVLSNIPDGAFTVKLSPVTLVAGVQQQQPPAAAAAARRAAAAAAAAATPKAGDGEGGDGDGGAAAAEAAADAAAARRGGKRGSGRNKDDGSGSGGKRAVQPLHVGDYVMRDDGTVSKITTESTKAGWSKTHSGRKAKRGESSRLLDPAAGLDAYEKRLKEITSKSELDLIQGQLAAMQRKIDEEIAARKAAEAARDKEEERRKAAERTAAASRPALVDLAGPPPSSDGASVAAAAAAAAAAQLNVGSGNGRDMGMLASLLAQQQQQQPPGVVSAGQAFLAQMLANENMAAAHDRNQSNMMMMSLFFNSGR